jgi:hypothetical protein
MSQDGNKVTVYIWPNGTYCFKEDLKDYLTFMSDDYTTEVFDTHDLEFDDFVENILHEYKNNRRIN